MTLNDPLANLLSTLQVYDQLGKPELAVTPVSKLVRSVLTLLNDNGYVGALEESKVGSAVKGRLYLLGRVNACGVIKPRFSVTVDELQKFEQRYLIAQGFGILIVSTPQGLMTHTEARKKNIGGRLIAYCY